MSARAHEKPCVTVEELDEIRAIGQNCRMSEGPALPPKFPTLLNRLVERVRSRFRRVRTSLPRFNEYVAAQWGTSVRRIVQVELAGFAGLAFTMMQISEHLAAILCWLGLWFVWVTQAASWEGVANRAVSAVLKTLYVLGVSALCILAIAIAVARRGIEPWSNLQKLFPRPCVVSVDVNDKVVDRVHLRARWLPSGGSSRQTEVYKPLFQDLFHDCVITVTPSTAASNVVVTIQDFRKPAATLRVDPPDNAQITEPEPKWVSGFKEPSQAPDFYIRTVKFVTLDKPTTITIRKAIKNKTGVNVVTNLDLDLDRMVQVSGDSMCKIVVTPVPTVRARLDRLIDQIKVLVVQKVAGGTQATTRLDPDERYPPLAVGESELVEEFICKDDPCMNLVMTTNEKTRIQ
jgi:hypothetical protein